MTTGARSRRGNRNAGTSRSRSRWPWLLAIAGGLIAVGVLAFLALGRAGSSTQAAWARLGTQDVHSLAFVGDDTQHLLFGHHDGVLESRDGGRSWKALPVRQDAMEMRPAADGSIVIAGHDVLSASRDGGATWSAIAADLPDRDIHGFARDPGDNARMWAYLASGGLWESLDSGSHWTRVRTDNVLYPVAVHTAAGTRLFGVDATGLASSDDGGRTWRPVGAPPTYPMTALTVSADAAAIYAGSLDGLFRSADGGRTWIRTSYAGSVLALAASADGSSVAVVSREAAFFPSADSGTTWPGAR